MPNLPPRFSSFASLYLIVKSVCAFTIVFEVFTDGMIYWIRFLESVM